MFFSVTFPSFSTSVNIVMKSHVTNVNTGAALKHEIREESYPTLTPKYSDSGWQMQFLSTNPELTIISFSLLSCFKGTLWSSRPLAVLCGIVRLSRIPFFVLSWCKGKKMHLYGFHLWAAVGNKY